MKYAYFVLAYLASGLLYTLLYQLAFRLEQKALQSSLSVFIIAWPLFLVLHALLETFAILSRWISLISIRLSSESQKE